MKKKLIIFCVAILLFFFSFIIYQSQLSQTANFVIYDEANKILKKNPSSHHVVLVEIDEISLQALGQWPWPRVLVAQLIDSIAIMQPNGIGLDILFPEADRNSPIQLKKFYTNFFWFKSRTIRFT